MLQVRDLSKHFGGLMAVNGVSLHVEPRTIHSVIGPNGAGKTTLFNTITGAYAADGGTVLFDGADVGGMPVHTLARRGLVRTFQRTNIFRDVSVLENVALALRSRRGWNFRFNRACVRDPDTVAEAHEILGQVGLAALAASPANAIGHGNQRALDIAIGLALKPRLILMDEPMAGMSRGDRSRIADLILHLLDTAGVTLVVVEHDIGMVLRLSHRITVLNHGRVIADGTPADIKADEAVRKAYLGGGDLG